jgi:hypothetical protein
MKRPWVLLSALLLVLGLWASAQATLIDNGGGFIYDTDFNITWLQDANYAKTSGYSSTGLMDWSTANTWATTLVYDGVSGWRLPTTLQPDLSCSGQGNGSFAANCTGSELGHLYYTELGGAAGVPPTNTSPFGNVSFTFWSGTEFGIANAWEFSFNTGYQYICSITGDFTAWAVHPGDVSPAAVPEPSTLLLLGSGLAGLGGLAWRRHRK